MPSKTRRRRSFGSLPPFAAAAAVVFVARTSLADHYIVPSGSMEPTVQVGDRILVDKLAFGIRVPVFDRYAVPLSDPVAGDVVVLTSPESGQTLLKRVVAVPGDLVSVRSGRVERNGTRAAVDAGGEWLGVRPHPLALDAGPGPDYGPLRLPPDGYLVMGDNRGNSHDGRAFGLVARDAIRGRAVAVFARDGHAVWERL